MSSKYQVADSKGQVHKRTTKDRTYTHCVVHHRPAIAASTVIDREGNPIDFEAYDAITRANWCGSEELARKEASVWEKYGYAVEIIPIS
jgi:hypothetical protein